MSEECILIAEDGAESIPKPTNQRTNSQKIAPTTQISEIAITVGIKETASVAAIYSSMRGTDELFSQCFFEDHWSC